MPPQTDVPRADLRRGASWVVGLRVVGIVSNVGVMLLATRLLGPAGFGEFTFLTSLIVLGGTLGMCGLNEAGLRFISESLGHNHLEHAQGYLSQIATTVLRASLLAAVVVGAGIAVYQSSSGTYSNPWMLICALAVCIVLLSMQQVTAESIRAFQDLRWASAFSGGQTGGPASNVILLACLGVTALFVDQLSLYWVIGFIAFSLVLTLPVALQALKKTRVAYESSARKNPATPEDDKTNEMKNVGRVLMLNQLLVLVTCHCDIWLGKALLTEIDLGYYSVAKRCLLLAAMPVQMAMMTILPSIPRFWSQQRTSDLERIVRSTATYAAIPSMIALSLLCLFPESLLSFAFGEEYTGAVTTVLVLIIGHVILVLCGNPPQVLAMTGKQSTVLVVNVLSSVVLLTVGILAAQEYGAVGLAAASTASLAVQHGVMWWLARKQLNVWTHIGKPLRQVPQ